MIKAIMGLIGQIVIREDQEGKIIGVNQTRENGTAYLISWSGPHGEPLGSERHDSSIIHALFDVESSWLERPKGWGIAEKAFPELIPGRLITFFFDGDIRTGEIVRPLKLPIGYKVEVEGRGIVIPILTDRILSVIA
jgi:hypothetical protein